MISSSCGNLKCNDDGKYQIWKSSVPQMYFMASYCNDRTKKSTNIMIRIVSKMILISRHDNNAWYCVPIYYDDDVQPSSAFVRWYTQWKVRLWDCDSWSVRCPAQTLTTLLLPKYVWYEYYNIIIVLCYFRWKGF